MSWVTRTGISSTFAAFLGYRRVKSLKFLSGGMSGGHVIHKANGQIVGLNSRSIGFGRGSVSVWLSILMDVQFDLNARLKYSDGAEFSLIDFALNDLQRFTADKSGIACEVYIEPLTIRK